MANDKEKERMNDLISRQAVIDCVKEKMFGMEDGTAMRLSCIEVNDIKRLPSVEVIKCKKCRFFIDHRCRATRGLDDWRTAQDFCSRAELKKSCIESEGNEDGE